MNRRSRKPQSLQIALSNANCLSTKKTELEEFVQRHQLDAVLIGETHLRASNRLTLPNFRVYRTDREDARGGGTAILVKSTIEHHADLALELINIEVEGKDSRYFETPIRSTSKTPHYCEVYTCRAYGVSKIALIALSKLASLQLAKKNVTVNCVAPGVIKTKFAEVVTNKMKN
ncbi:hypothetical protein Trydic_g16738 [Trypoxylus dichotomus]